MRRWGIALGAVGVLAAAHDLTDVDWAHFLDFSGRHLGQR